MNNTCCLHKNRKSNTNLLQILNQIEETINKKQLIEAQSKIVLSVSGGQDSIFLLFCLSFLQRQIDFNLKLIWCNHFWQKDSFYTTLHLTKSAHAFSLPIIGFIPLHVYSPLSFFQLGFLKNRRFFKAIAFRKKNRLIFKKLKLLRTKNVSTKFLLFKRFRSVRFLYKDFNRLLVIKTVFKGTQCPVAPQGHGQVAYKASLCKYPSVLSLKRRKKRSCACNKFFYKSQLYTCNCVTRLFTIKKVCGIFRKEKKFTEILSEATARNWRHITIERSCAFYNSNRCVHGHTLSDRVETILFNLIRGSGSKGITSLMWKRQHSSFCYNKFYPCLEQLKESTHINNC